MFVPAGAVLLCACASGGGPGTAAAPANLVPAEPAASHTLTYDLPSLPTATYAVSDTTVTVMNAVGNDVDMTMGSAATLELTFERDADGLLISGTVLDGGSSMSSATVPSGSVTVDDIEGDFEIVLGPLGEVQVRSLPESGGALALTNTLASVASDLFPRFPEDPVEFGDVWADTADASATEADIAEAEMLGVTGAESSGSTITTYTLVGDTVVAGRTLLQISIKVDGTMTSTAEVQGMEAAMDMTSVTDGFFLWDPERRLLAAVELMRTADTTTMMQDLAMTMTVVGTVTLRLVN